MRKIKMMIFIIIILLIGTIISNKDNVTYAIEDNLASVVMKQSKGTTWSSGVNGVYNTKYTKEDGTTIGSDYRYIGSSVNNYVKFNDDLYQIIGVFDENTHGKTGEQLVKLIRAKILGGYSWGVYNNAIKNGNYSNYQNDWTGKQYTTPSNLNILLNEYFYNKTSSSNTYGECSDWTYYYSSNNYKSKNCSPIVGYGIKKSLRNYIETVIWHLNGYSGSDLISNNFYLCERGMYTNCTSSNNGGGSPLTTAKIGLMYPSDYMYASGYKASNSTLTGYSYLNGSQNWLFRGYEWLITPYYNTNYYVYYISNRAYVYNGTSYSGYGIRPTFYLKEEVYVTGGNGTIDNPYTIACDNC